MPSYQDWLIKRKERERAGKSKDLDKPAKSATNKDEDDCLSVVSGSVYSAGGLGIGDLTRRLSRLEDTVISLAEQVQNLALTLESVVSLLEGKKVNRAGSSELDSSPILEK